MILRNGNSEAENLKALVDLRIHYYKKIIEDLNRKNFITDSMSLIDSLKDKL